MKGRKNLEYYLGLDYDIVIRSIPKAMGGGYMAFIPELGEDTCVGDGDTPQEAVESLDEIKNFLIRKWFAEGVTIPEPAPGKSFSGRFTVRMPASLHKELYERASQEGVSLNEYVVYMLSSAVAKSEAKTRQTNVVDIEAFLNNGLMEVA